MKYLPVFCQNKIIDILNPIRHSVFRTWATSSKQLILLGSELLRLTYISRYLIANPAFYSHVANTNERARTWTTSPR